MSPPLIAYTAILVITMETMNTIHILYSRTVGVYPKWVLNIGRSEW